MILISSLREMRDALEFRWTKRRYCRCYRFEDGSGYMCGFEVESIEPKRWQKFVLRLLSGLGHAPGGNPNRCPVTGARYSLPLELRQAFTKVESPAPEVTRVLGKIKRRFSVAVEQVQLPTDDTRQNQTPGGELGFRRRGPYLKAVRPAEKFLYYK
jgi:hypothetical protein